MEEIDYLKLYTLQDEILKIMSQLKNDFYLTGGTALHRFYYDARYSDDLDFFVKNGKNFNEDVEEVIDELVLKNYSVSRDVNSRDFYRIKVNNFLQIDFVNDRIYRYGKSNIIDNIRVDNKINILANKINTIVSRDEEKDVFDLFCLIYHEEFNWKNILKISNEKSIVEKDILIYRLQSFPLVWIDKIKKVKNIEISKDKINILCDDILYENDNSMVKQER